MLQNSYNFAGGLLVLQLRRKFMKNKRSLKAVLTCFMLTSIIGMGFTGHQVQRVNAASRSVYMEDAFKEDSDIELTKILEDEKNFIKV